MTSIRFPHDLAICAIIRNEAPYIREWVNWHLLVGVTKFYLYDNGSDDGTLWVLRPYEDAGIVERRPCPGKSRQIPAYNDCLDRHRYDAEWIAFIDADEFLHPLGEKSIPDILRGLRQREERMAGLGVNWRLFGSNGRLEPAPEGVLSGYTRRAADAHEAHNHLKTIADPRRARHFVSAHYPVCWPGWFQVDEQGRPAINTHTSETGRQALSCISLHHYVMKSRAEWAKRRALGKADCDGEYDTSPEAFAAGDALLNEVPDDSLPRLRQRLLAGRKEIAAPGPRQPGRHELEGCLHELLGGYGSLAVEELLALRHLYRRAPEAQGTLPAAAVDGACLSALHLHLTAEPKLRAGEALLLEAELRRGLQEAVGWELLQDDLERLRPRVEDWLLHNPGHSMDFYLDRLAAGTRPGYRPRVALVLPSLAAGGATGAEIALALQEAGCRVTAYAAQDGPLRERLQALGVPVLVDSGLLARNLSRVGWAGGYDLIWLQSPAAWHLLEAHGVPVPQPIVWWLSLIGAAPGEGGRCLAAEEALALVKDFSAENVSTLAETREQRDAWRNQAAPWPVTGFLQPPVAVGEAQLREAVRSIALPLLQAGLNNRLPFEENVV